MKIITNITIWFLVVVFASENHADITNSEAMAYNIRTVILDGDPQQITAVGQILLGPPHTFFKGRMEIDEELANFTAEVAFQELRKSEPNPIILIWMLRIIAESEDPRFIQFTQEIAGSEISARIKNSASDALTALDQADENTEMFIPGAISIDDYREELIAFKKNATSSSHRPENLNRAIRKAGTVHSVYALLGYPDHVETSFRFGRTGRVAILLAYWDNIAMVIFQDKKSKQGIFSGATAFNDFLRDMRVSGIRELDDLTSPENALAILNSPKAKDSKKLLKNLQNAKVIPVVLLDEMERLIAQQITEFDKRQSRNVIYMSQLLGRSRNPKYYQILENLWRADLNDDTKVIALKSLTQLFGQTYAVDSLMEMMKNTDSSVVRMAARAVFSHRIHDDRMLVFLAKRIQEDMDTEDRLLADGLGVMCKTIGESGVDSYIPSIEKITQLATNNGVRDHCKNSLRLLVE